MDLHPPLMLGLQQFTATFGFYMDCVALNSSLQACKANAPPTKPSHGATSPAYNSGFLLKDRVEQGKLTLVFLSQTLRISALFLLRKSISPHTTLGKVTWPGKMTMSPADLGWSTMTLFLSVFGNCIM